jgi:alpha-tubulin suppressor-like RCC1 family protein
MMRNPAICRGFGGWGQLGDGKSLNRVDSWVTVAGLGEFDQLLATGHTTCARLRNGGVACWGYNSAGQLGDGTKQPSERPLMVNGL